MIRLGLQSKTQLSVPLVSNAIEIIFTFVHQSKTLKLPEKQAKGRVRGLFSNRGGGEARVRGIMVNIHSDTAKTAYMEIYSVSSRV